MESQHTGEIWGTLGCWIEPVGIVEPRCSAVTGSAAIRPKVIVLNRVGFQTNYSWVCPSSESQVGAERLDSCSAGRVYFKEPAQVTSM